MVEAAGIIDDVKVPKMLTLKEASEQSGLSYKTLRTLCIDKKITHIKIGKKWFVNAAKLAEYLNEVNGEQIEGYW